MAARPTPAGQRRSRSELRTAAYRRGRSGKPAHDWIRDDPAHLAAFDQGRAQFAEKLDKTDLTKPPVADDDAGDDGLVDEPGGGSPRLDRASSKARGATGKFFTKGDGGGLLLAFVLYPLALSIIKYGAAGPALWFRAKWLNETAKAPNNLGPVAALRPDPFANVPGMPGYHTPGNSPLPGGGDPNDPWGPRPPGWQGPWPPGGALPPPQGTPA